MRGTKDIVSTGVFYLMLTSLIIRLYAPEPTIIKHRRDRKHASTTRTSISDAVSSIQTEPMFQATQIS